MLLAQTVSRHMRACVEFSSMQWTGTAAAPETAALILFRLKAVFIRASSITVIHKAVPG